MTFHARGMVAAAIPAAALVLAGCGARSVATSSMTQTPAVRTGGDWTRFGYDAARHNSGPPATGITAANVGKLVRRRVQLGGTADSSPIYLRGARVRGARHDVFVLTTSYGRTVAIDASSGTRLWRYT